MKQDRTTPPGLTPEESRHLDGELPASQASQLNEALAADVARARRLDRWRAATAVWREEAQEAAARVDPAAMAERVLAQVQRVRHPHRQPGAMGSPTPGSVSPALRAYAAAALLMIGVGIGGSLIVGLQGTPPRQEATALRLEDIERAEIDLLAEHPDMSPRFTTGTGR